MDPSPGWYPDVTQPGRKRWFDGSRWTEHRRDADDPDDDPPPPPARREASTDRTTGGWQAGQMPSAAPPPRLATSGMAIASLALGTLWIFGVGSFMGIVFALLALRRIRRAQGMVGGKVIAIMGLVVSLTTFSLTVFTLLNFDDVVDTVKDGMIEAATREELRRAGDAMQRWHEREGSFAGDIGLLVDVDYRPEDDVSIAVGRANRLTWCLEALHRDGTTVWRLERDGEPQTGRC